MKSFDEFLSTELTPEEKEKLGNIVYDSMVSELKQLSADESIPGSAAVLLLNLKATTSLTIEILRKYHDWLSKQL